MTTLEPLPLPADYPDIAEILDPEEYARRVARQQAQEADWAAQWEATIARYETTLPAPPAESRARAEPIEWSAFLTRDLTDVPWLTRPLLARGQQIALVGDGKVGKSLLAQEWAWRLASGRPFLSDAGRAPVRVLYVDRENSDTDIQERMLSFGAVAEDLAGLVYVRFPLYRPLDTPDGGQDLVADVEAHEVRAVFLDTVSRMVEGKENDSDTWLNLYRYTHARLKRLDVACVRLDHFGKDRDRGSRGSSAKTQDVDHVWELSAQPGRLYRLSRTHTRTGHGDGTLTVRRLGAMVGDRWKPGETRHVLAADELGRPADAAGIGVRDISARLDAAGVPRTDGRERLMAAGRRLGIRVAKAVWEDVARYRKQLADEDQNLPRAGSPFDHGDLPSEDQGRYR